MKGPTYHDLVAQWREQAKAASLHEIAHMADAPPRARIARERRMTLLACADALEAAICDCEKESL